MLTETARVIRRDGNRVELELQRGSACSHCELSQGCGTGALGRLLGRRSRPMILETDQDCRPGDEVVLALPESALVRASLLLYGLPLSGMVTGGLLAALSGAPDWLVAGASAIGFYAAFKLAAIRAQHLEADGQGPHITGIHLNPGPYPRS